jgi:16S rRNA (adenine1518-N6/adenine1519-N6)-dimethyltransferase
MVQNGKVRPKKALGQHFLTDEGVSRRIADTLSEYVGTPVIEVGPGMGMLTKYLVADGHDVTVIEIDSESIAYLRDNFTALQGEHIVEGDFLEMNLAEAMGGKPFCVIGNYPYNISSQIFFKVLDYKDLIPCCSGMLQREVAERLAAGPGTKTRGILSVLLQAWYDVKYLFTVDEHVFNPPPKVKSGVIIMKRNAVTDLGCDERLFRTVVKTTFGQRRKTIRNSIRGLLPAGASLPESPLWAMRPEQLSVADFIELTNLTAQIRATEA